jgi:hypothetical protein
MTKKLLSLEEFARTRQLVVKGPDWCEEYAIGETSQEVMEYAGACFIYVYGPTTYSLIVGSEEWQSENLAELEQKLYEIWYLTEIAPVTDTH